VPSSASGFGEKKQLKTIKKEPKKKQFCANINCGMQLCCMRVSEARLRAINRPEIQKQYSDSFCYSPPTIRERQLPVGGVLLPVPLAFTNGDQAYPLRQQAQTTRTSLAQSNPPALPPDMMMINLIKKTRMLSVADREELAQRSSQVQLALMYEELCMEDPLNSFWEDYYEDTWGSGTSTPASSMGSTMSLQTPKHLKRGAAWRDAVSPALPVPGIYLKTDKSLLLDSCLFSLFSLHLRSSCLLASCTLPCASLSTWSRTWNWLTSS